MYHVFYVQTLKDGTTANDTVSFNTIEEAKSRFHIELGQVTISDVLDSVYAMIFDDKCAIMAFDNACLPAPEPEPEPTPEPESEPVVSEPTE